MLAAGVVILYAEPLPDALADVSVVHRPGTGPRDRRDRRRRRPVRRRVTSSAHRRRRHRDKNLHELGHVVFYVDQPDQKLLPGAVHARAVCPNLRPGHVIEFRPAR